MTSEPHSDTDTNAPAETESLADGGLELVIEVARTVPVGQFRTGIRPLMETANRDYFITTCGGLLILA